jgi:predicted SprT family Zn-dependent metalloprotease
VILTESMFIDGEPREVMRAKGDFRISVFGIYNELKPQADAIYSEMVGSRCSLGGKLVIKDLGRTAGKYSPERLYKKARRNGETVFVRCHKDESIIINSQLIDHPEDIRDTVAHELAHQVVAQYKRDQGIRDRRGKWSSHGATWKEVARKLGDSGDRCHQLPLKPKHKLRRYLYKTRCGSHQHLLSTIRHNRSEQSGGGQYSIDGKPLWFQYEVEEREPGVWVQRAVQP